MRRHALAVAAALSFALIGSSARANDADVTRDVRLTAVSGDAVTLYDSQHPDGVAAEAGLPLEQGDQIVTGDDSTAELAFDGGSSVVTINPNSDFTLRAAQRSSTVLGLSAGSLIAKIEKLLEGDNLQVQAPAAVAAVRGTEFGVEVDDGSQSHVGVFDEGRVEVQGASGGTEVLTPNQETSVARGQAPTRAAPLKRFAARRALMLAHVRRLAVVRRDWKALPAAQRREARAKALKRLRQRRLNRLRRMRHGQTPENRERRERERRQPRRQPRRKPGRKAQPKKPKKRK